jgi:hypothetical protein
MDDCIDDRFPVKRLSGRLLRFVLLLGLFALGLQERAVAQAGSTGGTIGKQDKSISGGEEADRPACGTSSEAASGEGAGDVASQFLQQDRRDVVVVSWRD